MCRTCKAYISEGKYCWFCKELKRSYNLQMKRLRQEEFRIKWKKDNQ